MRKWQNELIKSDYSPTYIKAINKQLVAIFNYAVKYYDLKFNPCNKAGSIGKQHADSMEFWTLNEFKSFMEHTTRIECRISYMLLFWTGIRLGELLALTPADYSKDKKTIRINKSYQRIEGEDIITEPKTSKSKRIIPLPNFLCEKLDEYLSTLFDLKDHERFIKVSKFSLRAEIDRVSKISGVKRIRIHDLRHSHASLLIELGFSPILISERLGHEKIETTLQTYSHLYPNKHEEVSKRLDILNSSTILVPQQ